MNIYKKIFFEFEKNNIEYLIVGGIAVNLYGYSRFTGDIDILLAINEDNLKKMENLMHELGYTERLPITIHDLSDKKKLKEYMEEKNLKAFTYISQNNPQIDIDIVITESINFSKYNKKKKSILIWDLNLPVVHINDLIKMKRRSNRDKDILDIEALLKLKNS